MLVKEALDAIHSSDGGVAFGGALFLAIISAFVAALLNYLITSFCNYKLFKEAGKDGWMAFIPILNSWVQAQICLGDRFGWVGILGIIVSMVPYIGSTVTMLLCAYIGYKYAESFSLSSVQRVLFIFFTPIMLIYMVITKNYSYVGPRQSLFSKNIGEDGQGGQV